MVFDTTSAKVPVTVAGRHLILFAPVIGGRRVVEVYDLVNDSTVTKVVGADSLPVWRVTVPPGARDFGAGLGTFSPEALRFGDGEVKFFTPLPPGVKQISFAYTLPESSFPLLVGMETNVDVMEVLLAETAAHVDDGPMKEEAAVDIEGQSFKRYVAFDFPAGSEIRITVPAGSPLLVVLLIVGTGMLVALALTFRRRAPVAVPYAGAVQRMGEDEAHDLARRIAELDERHAATQADPKAEAAYAAERKRLKSELSALLARRAQNK
jgi:hypothetical protein